MNIHDTERMASILTEQGYAGTEAMDEADLVIFNSCSIRDKAEQKACELKVKCLLRVYRE